MQSFLEHPLCFAFLCIIIDLCLGDPVYSLHPIRLLGLLLSKSENCLRYFKLDKRFGGFLLFLILFTVSFYIVYIIAVILFQIHWSIAYVWELYIGWNTIALKDLILHAKRIDHHANLGNLKEARFHTSRLTGRDTEKLDEKACRRAGVESMAESLVDGVLSPLFYMLIFGLPGAILFKIVSTMDSMVGYKNDRYYYFGWFGARFDDLLNYLPARLSFLFITLTALLHPKLSAKKAWLVGIKQHNPIPGPNAGWSEATVAGALSKKIIGQIWRNQKLVVDLWIGDPNDPPCGDTLDIYLTRTILYATVAICFLTFSVIYLFIPV